MGVSSNTETGQQVEGIDGGEAAGCPLCRDAGFVHPKLSSGEPDYSRIVPCSCRTAELMREKQSYLERFSNLGYLAHYSFDELKPDDRPQSVDGYATAHAAARRYAEAPQGWMVWRAPLEAGRHVLLRRR